MADFCRACSISDFQEDHKDLARLTKLEDWQQGKATLQLCEGCGPIQVDPEGNCVSSNCARQGEPNHGMPWLVEDSTLT